MEEEWSRVGISCFSHLVLRSMDGAGVVGGRVIG